MANRPKKKKSSDELEAGSEHNITAWVKPTSKLAKVECEKIIEFLLRSRIYKAITFGGVAYNEHQQEFWKNAVVDEHDPPKSITSTIQGQQVVVNSGVIRDLLGFKDSDTYPTTLNPLRVRGCMLRMGYAGKIDKIIHKAYFCPQYKYLAHVLIHCLGSRKAGFDEMREMLQSAMVALALRIKFNFSGMILHNLVENITLKNQTRFLMYPRYIQAIINNQTKDLTTEGLEKLYFKDMTDKTVGKMRVYGKKRPRPRNKRLIGHLINPNYITPPEGQWRNSGSDSETEDIHVPVIEGETTEDEGNDSGDESDDDASTDDTDKDEDEEEVVITKETPVVDLSSTNPTQSQDVSGSKVPYDLLKDIDFHLNDQDEPTIIYREETGKTGKETVIEGEKETGGGSKKSGEPEKEQKKKKEKKRKGPVLISNVLTEVKPKKVRYNFQRASDVAAAAAKGETGKQTEQSTKESAAAPAATPLVDLSGTSTGSAAIDAQLSTLNSMMLRFIKEKTDMEDRLKTHDDEVKKLREENAELRRKDKEREEEQEKLKKQLELVETENKGMQKILESHGGRIEAIHKEYREFRNRIAADEDGTMRFSLEEPAQIEGTSGSESEG